MVYLLVRGSVRMVVEGMYFPPTFSPFILTMTTTTMTVHNKDSYSSSHAVLLLLQSYLLYALWAHSCEAGCSGARFLVSTVILQTQLHKALG